MSDRDDRSQYFRFGVHASSPKKGSSSSARWNPSLSPVPGPSRPDAVFQPSFAYSRSSQDISSLGLSDTYRDHEPLVSSTTRSPSRRPPKKSSPMDLSLTVPSTMSTGSTPYSSSCSPTSTRRERPAPLDYMFYRPDDDDTQFFNYLEELDKDHSARAMMESQRYVGAHYQQRTYPRPSRADWLETRRLQQRGLDLDLKDYSREIPPPGRHLPRSPKSKGPKDLRKKNEVRNHFSYAAPPPITSLARDESLDETDLFTDHWC